MSGDGPCPCAAGSLPGVVNRNPEAADYLSRVCPPGLGAKALFANVDFSELPKVSSTYVFSDDPSSPTYTQPSINLWTNLRSAGSYTFSWPAP